MSDKFPPRVWLPINSLLEDMVKQYDVFVQYHGDEEYISVKEKDAIVSELERKLEKAEKTIIDILESPMPWWIDKLAKELLEEVLKKDEKQSAEIEGTK